MFTLLAIVALGGLLLVLGVCSAKNVPLSESLGQFEDREQMEAIRQASAGSRKSSLTESGT